MFKKVKISDYSTYDASKSCNGGGKVKKFYKIADDKNRVWYCASLEAASRFTDCRKDIKAICHNGEVVYSEGQMEDLKPVLTGIYRRVI